MKNGCPKGSNKSSESSHWASMVELFEIFGVFEQMCFLMSFWIGKKSAQNSKTSSTLTDKLIPMGWLGRGRRERRRAREEKELGF